MARSVRMAHLRAHLSEIVGEVQHLRARIVIEKHGKPVAMLVPLAGARPAGLLGLIGAFEDAPEFSGALDAVVNGRRKEGRRKVSMVNWLED